MPRPRGHLAERLERARAQVIRDEVRAALNDTKGHHKDAARRLGISYRQLFLLMKRYRLEAP